MTLANVGFYLSGTARVWFDTHETELTSWDLCKQKLRDLFGKPIGRQSAASKDLSCRAQSPTESYVSYILDVIALCRRVDATMTEADKVSHVLKGIADDAFNLLVFKDCSTIEDIIKECRRFEALKSRRIAQQFMRLPNTAATSSCADVQPPNQQPTTDSLVRIVRREIEAASPPSYFARPSDDSRPTVSLIQAVVREELANAGLQPVASLPHPRVSSVLPSYRNTATLRRYRDPAQWRTQDDKPICFHCHGVGHISRHCRYRQPSSPRSFFDIRRDDNWPLQFPARNNSPLRDAPVPTRSSSRSPSPHDRRSRSPLPRRYSSPHPSGRSSQEN